MEVPTSKVKDSMPFKVKFEYSVAQDEGAAVSQCTLSFRGWKWLRGGKPSLK